MTVRWPLQPLLDATGLTAYGLAHISGMNQGTIRAATAAGLTDQMADRLAVRLGWHPAMIWPGWVDAGLTVPDRMFLEEGWRPAWLWREQQKHTAVAA